jgi:hypothetical protein
MLGMGLSVMGCKKDRSSNPPPASSQSPADSELSPADSELSPADSTTTLPIGTGLSQVFSFNDLGMHCYDADFSVFAVLPPYNVVRAQVLLKGLSPKFLDNTQVDLTYRAVTDPTGSINRTSQNKTNFWTYAFQLFGANLPVDVGLSGAAMPGAANIPQPLGLFDPLMHWFSAEGIPITNWDDAMTRNTLPLMRVRAAHKATGTVLSELDTVVPASDEMNCSNCHITGGVAADAATVARHNITQPWSANPNRHRPKLSAPASCTTCPPIRRFFALRHYSQMDLTHQGPRSPDRRPFPPGPCIAAAQDHQRHHPRCQ